MSEIMKNIEKSKVLLLKDEVAYQPGQIVSKTLVQNDAISITLFAFDKDEEISTHESGGDAMVLCLDGVGKITIDGTRNDYLISAETSVGSITAFGVRINGTDASFGSDNARYSGSIETDIGSITVSDE